MRELVARCLDEVRQLAFDLRPTVLDDIGLAAAVRRLASDLSERFDLQIPVQITAEGDEAQLTSEVETVIYRVVQESLTNVVRHARASRATVEVSIEQDHVRAVVVDDGVGFALDDGVSRSLGLAGMRERALLVDGGLDITSAPGEGTAVVVEVPR